MLGNDKKGDKMLEAKIGMGGEADISNEAEEKVDHRIWWAKTWDGNQEMEKAKARKRENKLYKDYDRGKRNMQIEKKKSG